LDLSKLAAATKWAVGKIPKPANPIVYTLPPAWFTADAHIDAIPRQLAIISEPASANAEVPAAIRGTQG